MQTNKDTINKTLVTIILPAFNEEVIIEKNISRLYDYLETLPKLLFFIVFVFKHLMKFIIIEDLDQYTMN